MHVGTVLGSGMFCCADVETCGVVEELIDRDNSPGGQCVFKGIMLPKRLFINRAVEEVPVLQRGAGNG